MSEEVTPAPETPTENTGESEKLFTQTEVNSLIAKNKREVQAKFADYDELKTTVEKLEDLKSEAFNSGKTTAMNEMVGRLVDTEIRSAATAMGFADSNDALTFFSGREEITYDPETGLDTTAITERLKGLAESKPYLLKIESGTGTNSNTSRPKPKNAEPVDTDSHDDARERAAAALRNRFAK